MVGLILLCVHYALATEFGKIPKLAPVSAWKTAFVINFGSSTKVGSRGKRYLLLRAKLLLEKVSNGVITLLLSILLGADVNNGDIVNL